MRPLNEAAKKDIAAAEDRFDRCTSAFFDDDWEAVVRYTKELQAISSHWQEEAKSLPADDPFSKFTQRFDQAVRRLDAAAPEQHVGKTTAALRDLSRHLADLKRLDNETDQEKSASQPEAQGDAKAAGPAR